MLNIFISLLAGNLMSKFLLVSSDALAFLSLSSEDFGVFALFQAAILSTSIICVWGKDQAIINMFGRFKASEYNLNFYLISMRIRVLLLSGFGCLLLWVLIENSPIIYEQKLLIVSFLILLLEPQLYLNSAAIRTLSSPLLSVTFFDGLRHLSLFVGAFAIFMFDFEYLWLFFLWALASLVSFVAGQYILRFLLKDNGPQKLPDVDLNNISEISRFSGMWSAVQAIFSRVILVISAYLLSPSDLGVVAFFLKLLVIFTFIHTVVVQTLSPYIGALSSNTTNDEASQINRITRLFLSCTVTPSIGACLLSMAKIIEIFSVEYLGSFYVLFCLFVAQAINLGTGVIGHFIIHYGYPRELLKISLLALATQLLLLVILGQKFGVEGVLLSYAFSSLFLACMKSILAQRKLGFHGFGRANLCVIFICSSLCMTLAVSNNFQFSAANIFTFMIFSIFVIVSVLVFEKHTLKSFASQGFKIRR